MRRYAKGQPKSAGLHVPRENGILIRPKGIPPQASLSSDFPFELTAVEPVVRLAPDEPGTTAMRDILPAARVCKQISPVSLWFGDPGATNAAEQIRWRPPQANPLLLRPESRPAAAVPSDHVDTKEAQQTAPGSLRVCDLPFLYTVRDMPGPIPWELYQKAGGRDGTLCHASSCYGIAARSQTFARISPSDIPFYPTSVDKLSRIEDGTPT
ncbi:hypothetical protein F4861DRAFT_262283 [Xylaria intraflava]|nr:hypothetical protein F4861DRAFT_262283 [Xylaria intraflava]